MVDTAWFGRLQAFDAIVSSLVFLSTTLTALFFLPPPPVECNLFVGALFLLPSPIECALFFVCAVCFPAPSPAPAVFDVEAVRLTVSAEFFGTFLLHPSAPASILVSTHGRFVTFVLVFFLVLSVRGFAAFALVFFLVLSVRGFAAFALVFFLVLSVRGFAAFTLVFLEEDLSMEGFAALALVILEEDWPETDFVPTGVVCRSPLPAASPSAARFSSGNFASSQDILKQAESHTVCCNVLNTSTHGLWCVFHLTARTNVHSASRDVKFTFFVLRYIFFGKYFPTEM